MMQWRFSIGPNESLSKADVLGLHAQSAFSMNCGWITLYRYIVLQEALTILNIYTNLCAREKLVNHLEKAVKGVCMLYQFKSHVLIFVEFCVVHPRIIDIAT